MEYGWLENPDFQQHWYDYTFMESPAVRVENTEGSTGTGMKKKNSDNLSLAGLPVLLR